MEVAAVGSTCFVVVVAVVFFCSCSVTMTDWRIKLFLCCLCCSRRRRKKRRSVHPVVGLSICKKERVEEQRRKWERVKEKKRKLVSEGKREGIGKEHSSPHPLPYPRFAPSREREREVSVFFFFFFHSCSHCQRTMVSSPQTKDLAAGQ